MLFGKDKNSPKAIAVLGLGKWYDSLGDQDKVRLEMYLESADTSSKYDFAVSVADAAIKGESYAIVAPVCRMTEDIKLSDMQRFQINERLIESLFHTNKVDDCIAACEAGLELVPKVKAELLKDGIPDRILCRNHLIDIVVGVKADFDAGVAALERFNAMGILSDEDLRYRKQSLKVYRLQRTFESVYSLTPNQKSE